MGYTRRLILSLILAASLLWCGLADAADAVIDEVVLDRTAPPSVSFVVRDAFNRDIEEAISSGAPVSFTFLVELERVRPGWFDETIAEREFKHTVKYDSLKEEYEVRLDERGGEAARTRDALEMKALMATVKAAALTLAKPIEAGQDYEVRLKAELRTVKLPLRLDYVLFFVRLWDFETKWLTARFRP